MAVKLSLKQSKETIGGVPCIPNKKAKVVRKMSLFDKSVEIINGKLREGGVSDGAAGKHHQPTSLCTELKIVFVCDTAAKMIKMIVNSDELVQYLEKLELLLIA